MARSSNTGLGIDWNFSNHIGLINNRGSDVIHEIGLRCTCNYEDTYAGMVERGPHVARKRKKFGCNICNGEGYIYRNPKKIVGMVTGHTSPKNQTAAGWLTPDDAILSIEPGVTMAAGDKITFLWEEEVPDGQVIVRGAASMNDNAAKNLNLEDTEDRLHYHAVSSFWCEDDAGKTYSSNSDFVLDGSRIIKWKGNRPNVGQAYSIKYTAYLEWIVFMPPIFRRDRNRDLGSRIGLRKRHIALLNEDPTVRITDRTTFCDRFSQITC